MVLLTLFLMVSPANAAFMRTGPASAFFCKSFVFFSTCNSGNVDHFETAGGIIPVPTAFEDVSEFNEGKGRCFIFFKQTGYSGQFIGRGARLYDGKTLITDNADYLTFRCEQH